MRDQFHRIAGLFIFSFILGVLTVLIPNGLT